MHRISRICCRTSRKGPGGWSLPTFVSTGDRSASSPRPSIDNHANVNSPKSKNEPHSGNHGPHVYSWRANKAFDFETIGRTILGDAYDMYCPPSPSGLPPHTSRISAAASKQEGAKTQAPPTRPQSTNWLGSPTSTHSMLMQRHFGVNDFSLIDRKELTLTKTIELMMNATFKPRDADSRVFGGDNRTKIAEQREEFKNMDSRIVPFMHDDLMFDYLKNINQLHGPSGQLYTRDILVGRLVGLLYFTESERSLAFMRELKRFHQKHTPDFVVVSISLGGKEMMDVSRQFGFYHCSHRDGATWVTRDAGLMMRPWTPMPRLIIVNGSTGVEITRSGLTAVLVNPDTCFDEWKRGESGVKACDWLQTIYIG
ncbi:unnamed protein product [Phytomonas sp. EM1]|nr:unnamed protein product [Phytomonas sp. EM1]|eukprot:CCW64476.1 unnamed protein product [Phytomonas sp. isolate EM1]